MREVRDLGRKKPKSGRTATPSAAENGAELRLEPIGPAKRPRPAKKTRRSERKPRRAAGAPASDGPEPEIPLHSIDRDALEVVRRLRRFGHTAYLVGGCVRDLSVGIKPKDFDVATSARPEEVKAAFRNCRIIGRRFRLAHIYFRGQKVIETSTFRAAVEPTEENGEDLLIRSDNVFGSEEEDAKRRDFTVNGLFYDPASGRIIDHVDGKIDLANRVVRMIGDPDIRLREDPIRILRAVRIAAKCGLTIEPKLLEAMHAHQEDISRCAPARVLEETFKLLRNGNAEKSVRLMFETGVLAQVLPQTERRLRARTEPTEGEPEPGVFEFLAALDTRFRRSAVSDAVVLGALLYEDVLEIRKSSEPDRVHRKTIAYLNTASKTMGATKRTGERLRQIVAAQRHFERAQSGRRTRGRLAPANLMRRAYFEDSLDLFEIFAMATGRDAEDVRYWRERSRGRPTEDDGDAPPPRRRRKRRRRQKPAAGGTESGTE